MVLTGHDTEGYSLEWNHNKDGHIVAGSYDGKLTLWDLTTKEESLKVKPLSFFEYHTR